MTQEPKKDAPKVMMLPPTLVLQHIAAGITFNWVMQFLMPFSLSHAWGWLGLILLAAAFFIVAWAKNLFDKAGTNVPPNQPATAIVTTGVYQYTRNPMYLSFMLGFAGLAFLAGAPYMLLALLPLYYFLDQRVIVPEEEYLTEKFGEEYLAYKNQVKRWF